MTVAWFLSSTRKYFVCVLFALFWSPGTVTVTRKTPFVACADVIVGPRHVMLFDSLMSQFIDGVFWLKIFVQVPPLIATSTIALTVRPKTAWLDRFLTVALI